MMNADFEAELAAWPSPYRRLPTIERRNRRLAPVLLHLAAPGDALALARPWSDEERVASDRAGVALVASVDPDCGAGLALEPWGWTPSAVAFGMSVGATVDPVPVEIVARVNSKAFSHAVERELGVAVPGAGIAASRAEVDARLARICPGRGDKWVVKGLFGFAARERVLGRGPALDPASALWVERRVARGERLLVEPWLQVTREYGVQLDVARDGCVDVLGVSRMQTNGAGVTTGFVLGDRIEPDRAAELERIARDVGRRLADEGYRGPANVDALEHSGGLRPLLEINARRTMGLVALAVERERAPREPTVWAP